MSNKTSSELSAVNSDFSPEYKESAFLIWYKSGRISMKKMIKILLPAEDGRIPSLHTIQLWFDSEGWSSRADIMDAEVAKEIERTAIQEKIQMIRRHAAVAQKLISKGEKYLEAAGIDKSADAIRAIVQGVEIERISRGIALGEISKLSDTDLVNFVQRKLEELSTVGPDVKSDFIDGESRDVTNAESS